MFFHFYIPNFFISVVFKRKRMANEHIDILLAHQLLGTITGEEKQQLDKWLNESEEHHRLMSEIGSNPDFTTDYRKYASIDTDKAWEDFKNRNIHSKRLPLSSRKFVYAAAAVLALCVCGITALWYQEYTHITAPELSSNVIAAIEKSVESGYADNLLGDEIKKEAATQEQNAKITAEKLNGYQLSVDMLEDILNGQHIETVRDRESWLKLDDGTIVHLSANTRIIYPEHFKKASLLNPNPKREIIVDGEAYFMVAHDKSRQFIVHTRHGDIQDYGTQFFVSTSEDSTKVALIEGSIGFTPQGREELLLKPGEEATIVTSGVTISDKNMEEYRAWNTGKFFFEDETLEAIAHVARKWYSVNIVFADNDINGMHFSGSFDRYNDVEDMIDAICYVTGLNWTRKNVSTIVISR